MKKWLIAVFVSIIFFVSVFALTIGKDLKEYYKYRSMFNNWDNGLVSELDGTEIMKSFEWYLNNGTKNYNDTLRRLSPFLKIWEGTDEFRIIEYIENPEYYGNSGRRSYHIVTCNGKNKIIDSGGSIRIYGFIKRGDNQVHILVTNYKFSNITGINIIGLEINEDNIGYEPILAKDNLPKGFQFTDSLYHKDSHIFFEDIRCNEDGENEIVIKVNDTEHILKLKDDGLYHLIY